ncbi:Potassium voltage-gated channel subfamily H member 3 [Operophtera brumata]|uniref:Potassium voltage-gated channel subfamily H member 3 n=1 Tax=Operophtera brumata TaxID=104452 RepID=A0A0L7LRP0_OPEBR|nr:Potassium voltage-gated channel subfamily H member 3 [Operophtera brumata]
MTKVCLATDKRRVLYLSCKAFYSRQKSLLSLDSNFVLGNAQVPAYPIVYCSDGFCELTGWARAHIMQKGCACKFLHGVDTRDEHRKEIDSALDTKSELKLELIFYKKNGKRRLI